LPAFAALLVFSFALAGCTSNTSEDSTAIAVTVSDTECVVSAASASAGHTVFAVTNDGSSVAEFYLYESNGTSIVSEVENIGPGLTRDLVVSLDAGTYVTACDPGMDGDEIRADFTVTEDGAAPAPTGEKAEALAGASAEYLSYVRDEVATLIDKTQAFADAFEAGDDDTARSLYADARVHWERIEPIAESFGDLDPLLDLREADLGPQELWTGWHHAEKVLWPPSEGYVVTDAERTALAEGLVKNTLELERRVTDEAFVIEAFQVGNGAKELLDEVATSKITGEEEIWSGTDLWDMQANIDGALAAYTALRPIVEASDPELVTQLDARFADVNDLLATHGSIAEGFVTYTELSDADVVALSRAIEALSEPLARLTAAAVL
jgi:iron uptake system component EfeO